LAGNTPERVRPWQVNLTREDVTVW